MDIAVKELIQEVGVENLRRISGIPTRTLYRWQANDSIPGSGPRREWTVKQFQEAVAKARAEKRRKPTSKKRRAAA
jgi:hypothetical protein